MLISLMSTDGKRARLATLALRAGAFGVVALVTMSIVGCVPIFPTRPDFSADVSMTVEHGHFAFVQCIESGYAVDYISIMAGSTVDKDKERLFLSELKAGESGSSQLRV